MLKARAAKIGGKVLVYFHDDIKGKYKVIEDSREKEFNFVDQAINYLIKREMQLNG